MAEGRVTSSFRDPSGYLFTHQGKIYRQINNVYRKDYDHLIESGLYDTLVQKKLLVPHSAATNQLAPSHAYKVIEPERIPFVSYPYEWCFGQLKDAALLTLEIQEIALQHGMILKDSSAYNVQFLRGRPVVIDTLSFARYREGEPWVAYRQFCQHFLGPLAIMSYRDVRLSQLFRVHIDGIPLSLASALLPQRSRLNIGLLTHLHIHARAQNRYAGKSVQRHGSRKMSRRSLRGLIDNLAGTVGKLRWRLPKSEWGDYYHDTNYAATAMRHKQQIVSTYLDAIRPQMVWDLGANTGVFSRIAASKGALTMSFDIDPVAVEQNYNRCKREGDAGVLPLVIDLTNPSPALGWGNQERMSLPQRGPVDTVLALALLHHLAISNNVPLGLIARFLGSICRSLIVEFVPKTDSQVQRLLATREDIFTEYDRGHFEAAFAECFIVEDSVPIEESDRIVYRMTKRA
ncbi:MAG: SAM-dependent methyltransferase [Candidatus Krumholzibacteria bacterium]|nr:SAM-dependent methyltransferase [Candidatus Krumholzibacteria bacterium]